MKYTVFFKNGSNVTIDFDAARELLNALSNIDKSQFFHVNDTANRLSLIINLKEVVHVELQH